MGSAEDNMEQQQYDEQGRPIYYNPDDGQYYYEPYQSTPQPPPPAHTGKKYPEPLIFYRKKNAFNFSIGKNKQGKVLFFVSSAFATGQDANGNTSYDWDNKGVMALNVFEIGAILLNIENYFNTMLLEHVHNIEAARDLSERPASLSSKGQGGIYHKSPKGGTSQIYFGGKKERFTEPGFGVTMIINKGQKVTYGTVLSIVECRVLKILLEEAVKIIHNWRLILE